MKVFQSFMLQSQGHDTVWDLFIKLKNFHLKILEKYGYL